MKTKTQSFARWLMVCLVLVCSAFCGIFGANLLAKSKTSQVHAYEAGSWATLSPNQYHFGGLGSLAENETFLSQIISYTITNKSEWNGVKFLETYDKTLSGNPFEVGSNSKDGSDLYDGTGTEGASSLKAYLVQNGTVDVINASETQQKTAYDCYVYADVEKIYFPSNSRSLFCAGDFATYGHSVRKFAFDDCIDTSNVKNMSSLFSDMVYLESITGLEYFDTSKVTSFDYMFKYTPKLDEQTRNAVSALFANPNNTASATSMRGVFESGLNYVSMTTDEIWEKETRAGLECTLIENSGYDPERVYAMTDDQLIAEGNKLMSIDNKTGTKEFWTLFLTAWMFSGNDCGDPLQTDLTSCWQNLDISHLNTSAVTMMSSMFTYCDVTNYNFENFDTSKVKEMEGMFMGCTSQNILDLSSFNTASVTNMVGMFSACTSQTGLDLSSFDMSAVTKATSMFTGSNLPSITMPKALPTDANLIIKLPSTYFAKDDPTISGDTLNAFASYLSTDSQKREIVQGYGVSIATGYGALLTDGSETKASFTFAYPKGNTATATISENTIAIGGKTITANSTSVFSFAEWQIDGVAVSGTINLTNDTTIKAAYSSLLPAFELSDSTIVGLSQNYTLSDGTTYDFTADSYNATIDSANHVVTLTGYTSTNTTKVVIPSQILIDGEIYAVKIDNSTNGANEQSFFANAGVVTSISTEKIGDEKIVAESCAYMFYGCTNLTTLNLSNFDTSNVTNMNHMFAFTFADTLDLSSFEFKSDCDVTSMFGDAPTISDEEMAEALYHQPETEEDDPGVVLMINSLIDDLLISIDSEELPENLQAIVTCRETIEKSEITETRDDFLNMTTKQKMAFYDNFIEKYAVFVLTDQYLGSGDVQHLPTDENISNILNIIRAELYPELAANLGTYAQIQSIILPATVNGLEIALPTGDYAVDGTDKYAYTTLKGYNDLKTANGTSYPAGVTLQNKALVPETPTETGVETNLLFALSGAVVIALFAFAVAHVGKKKKTIKK